MFRLRDDGLGQNDQFNFLQFVYFCVIMKQYSLTVQVFTVGTTVCHSEPLAKGFIVRVLQCHIFMQDISNASLHVQMRFDTS